MPKKGDIKSRVGEKFTTNEGYIVRIINYNGVYDVDIIFESGFIIHGVGYGNLVKGTIRNPFHQSVHEIGFTGDGKYGRVSDAKCYQVWNSMICRTSCKKYQEKFPTYKGVTVFVDWLNFQNFAEWFYENYKDSFELDKDIIIPNSGIYSPDTCCFVPKEVNYLFTKRQNKRGKYPIGVSLLRNKIRATITKGGVSLFLGNFETIEEAFQAYKIAKEAYIKEVAEKWKHLISDKVYQAMYNYEVKITD